MSIWKRFIDRIFDSPFGKSDPEEKAAAEARGAAVEQQLLDNMKAAQERERRQSRRGKHWEYVGDRLHLDGFPITIRRATADEVRNRGGIFCVECDSLMPNFAWTLEDAQFVGERWAREIDALPLDPGADREPSTGNGERSDDLLIVPLLGVGLVWANPNELDRICKADITPAEAVEQGLANVDERWRFRLTKGVILPGEQKEDAQ